MSHLTVAGLQLDLKAGDNLDRIDDEVRTLRRRFGWVSLVVLGELSCFGVDKAFAEAMPGPTEARLAALARDTGLWLVPGSMYELRGEQIFNTMPVIDPSGQVIARYRKMFPFRPYETGVAAGEDFVVFDIPGVGRIGVSNCYDMWFPETSRTLAWMGAEVILHPGLTNTIDRDAEQAIARATATINQCYFVDINVAGDLGVGRSSVFGPGGEVIHQAGAGREVIALDLDLNHVRRVRERGWNGLGQTLKSFRDGPRTFPPYGSGHSPALDALGPLDKPAFETAPTEPGDQTAGRPDLNRHQRTSGG